MNILLDLEILPQPDDTTCGPTSLHAIYSYYDDEIPLNRIISEVISLEEGGTLAVSLACHALKRGYKATIYTYNLQMFDPSWFNPTVPDLAGRLISQSGAKNDPKLSFVTEEYIRFLGLGGRVKFEDLRPALIRHYLKKGHPVLTGLSATYLNRSIRETVPDCNLDDIEGYPVGHFVILYGYNRAQRKVMVADPLFTGKRYYEVDIHRLSGSILLGIVTYDANLMIIEPGKKTG